MNNEEDKRDPLTVLGCSKGFSRNELISNLKRHCNYTPSLIKEINKIPDVVLRNLGTPTAKKLVKMNREINIEAYRAIQFTRTEINNRGVLYGIVLLKHHVIDRILNYFHERWPRLH